MPLLSDLAFDVFWNAASFGEMEPDVVENYLGYLKGDCGWIYLLQARHSKETGGRTHVREPIEFADTTGFCLDTSSGRSMTRGMPTRSSRSRAAISRRYGRRARPGRVGAGTQRGVSPRRQRVSGPAPPDARRPRRHFAAMRLGPQPD
jgi:hypothetical protein